MVAARRNSVLQYEISGQEHCHGNAPKEVGRRIRQKNFPDNRKIV